MRTIGLLAFADENALEQVVCEDVRRLEVSRNTHACNRRHQPTRDFSSADGRQTWTSTFSGTSAPKRPRSAASMRALTVSQTPSPLVSRFWDSTAAIQRPCGYQPKKSVSRSDSERAENTLT